MDSNLKIFSWNCQGSASRKFSYVFREYNAEHSPDIVDTKVSLAGLKFVSPAHNIPWLIMGDFNAILSLEDKRSSHTASKRYDLFGNFVESCALQDLGYNGPSYTWQRGGTFVRLDRALGNIQKAIDRFSFSKLIQKELEIRDELENLGDRNAKFYYSWTIKRRNFNRITTLRIDNGEWCTDQDILRNKTVEFFERLYGENQWDILGGDVCQWVKGVFSERSIEQELNNTLIILIPKKESPEDFSQFRPISLCSMLYKLVMNVIANRFNVVFPKLISQEQTGFIAGRNISDNIILAQEVIHSMRCKRKWRNWMAVKLDLEKAYDRISWDFISISLAGIPFFLRRVIMSAITSPSMQILWNGVPTQKFKPVRGIRQGFPLSPYLFVLSMEWFGHIVRTEMNAGK
ncbi:hypothetical protein J1N35_014170 [Gossypium stocksii]|uniref:Reverse transcriptase domain-containing protein n=1 Tax=Gossypium stocksii TaxID=47602 RepID=A0A9D4A922_9ROSI|nr:hypothetical protein J1N35_014170 [Gossypium stocksii]